MGSNHQHWGFNRHFPSWIDWVIHSTRGIQTSRVYPYENGLITIPTIPPWHGLIQLAMTHLNTDVGWSCYDPLMITSHDRKSNIPIVAYSWWFFYQFNPMIIPSLSHENPIRKSNESAKQSPTGCPHIPWWLLLSLPLWEIYIRVNHYGARTPWRFLMILIQISGYLWM